MRWATVAVESSTTKGGQVRECEEWIFLLLGSWTSVQQDLFMRAVFRTVYPSRVISLSISSGLWSGTSGRSSAVHISGTIRR
jgi:hypothetical protein